MRFFISAEGESDEIIAESLILSVDPFATIVKKTFTSRGFNVVRRMIPICVRAAHFGHYDALVVHFDLDATLATGFSSVKDSERWQHAAQRVSDTLNTLDVAGRTRGLTTLFMAPCQSTDAWIDWGLYGGDGHLCERKPAKLLKQALYGSPPIGMVAKANEYKTQLLAQMASSKEWPTSLREFIDAVEHAVR